MNLENLRYKSSVTEMLGMLTGMVFGKVGGLGGIMRGMLGVMLQYLYGS